MNDLDKPLMDTAGGQIGHFIGLLVWPLVVPLILMIVFKFIPAMRRRPKLTNSICAWISVPLPFLSADTPLIERALAAYLLAALFSWNYHRDEKALTKNAAT